MGGINRFLLNASQFEQTGLLHSWPDTHKEEKILLSNIVWFNQKNSWNFKHLLKPNPFLSHFFAT